MQVYIACLRSKLGPRHRGRNTRGMERPAPYMRKSLWFAMRCAELLFRWSCAARGQGYRRPPPTPSSVAIPIKSNNDRARAAADYAKLHLKIHFVSIVFILFVVSYRYCSVATESRIVQQ